MSDSDEIYYDDDSNMMYPKVGQLGYIWDEDEQRHVYCEFTGCDWSEVAE